MSDRRAVALAKDCAKPRVCIVTTVHPPLDARVYSRQAVTLSSAGFDVTLIAVHERDEDRDGVRILSLGSPRSRLARVCSLGWRALSAAARANADVYHLHDPELLLVGLVLRMIGRRVIYDAHEDLRQQILSKDWIPHSLRRPISWLAHVWLHFALHRMSGVVAATDGVADALDLPARPTVVKNYPVLALIPEASGRAAGDVMRMIYLGSVSEERGAVEMLEAARTLADLPIEMVIQGRASASLTQRLKEAARTGPVTCLPWSPPRAAYRSLVSADVGLVCLHPLPRFLAALPVKLFEYMAVGIPVVASDFPLWREIVEGAECGLLVDPLDPSAIADALRFLVEHPEERVRMGRNGRAAVEAKYNWALEAPKLLDLYARVLSGQGKETCE
ncbi:glycosyltransferase family 4 protein [Candidatus Bipolaricaulota bacterium]